MGGGGGPSPPRVAQDNIVKVYLSTVRLVLAYVVPVWQPILLIPHYLSDVITGVQKRALKIIYPKAESYTEALQFRANMRTLKKRRDDLCAKYMDRIRVLINYFLD